MPDRAPPESRPLRVGVMLDMSWTLRRHVDIFAGIARYAADHAGWSCVVDDFAADTIAEERGRRRAYDGVIARVTPQLAKVARAKRIPLVNVWYSSPVRGVPSVVPDFAAAGRQIAEHLVDRGLRQVLCLARRGDKSERLTADTIATRVRAERGRCQTHIVPRDFQRSRDQWRRVRSLFEKWVSQATLPVGLYTGVDLLARLLAQTCADLGLHVPRDIAIVAGSNEPTLCDSPEPALTSTDVGYDRIGYEAARMMDHLLAGGAPPHQPLHVPPHELVVRSSSDFVYVDEPTITAAMQYIAAQVRKPITVDDVAAAAGVSRRTLEYRFRDRLGRSVAAEMRRVRIEHAKRLLAGSDMAIGAIARTAGFGDNAQMTRVFQRELGITPRAYRRTFEDER